MTLNHKEYAIIFIKIKNSDDVLVTFLSTDFDDDSVVNVVVFL